MSNVTHTRPLLLAFTLMLLATTPAYRSSGADLASNSPLRNQVQVGEVTGGARTNTAWGGYFVDAKFFSKFLQQKLSEKEILGAGNTRFLVTADLLEFTSPALNGFNFDGFISASIRYRVTKAEGQVVVFEETIRNSTRVDSQPGPNGRIRRHPPSEETVVGKNIAQFINALVAKSETDPAFLQPN